LFIYYLDMTAGAKQLRSRASARSLGKPPVAPEEPLDFGDSDPYALGLSEFDLSPGIKVIPYELGRNALLEWESIKVGSLDWRSTHATHPRALVARVSSIVSDSKPEYVTENLRACMAMFPGLESALHVVCMFKEFSVSASSPLRYTANFWFIFPELKAYDAERFEKDVKRVLPEESVSYVTLEVLSSFLTRREYENKEITGAEAKSRLQAFMRNFEPCSSLFLKLSPECTDLCKQLLAVAGIKKAKYLVGVRAIHKLAVSCTLTTASALHNYNETVKVMRLGLDSKDWSFVVYKTLTRLAAKIDKNAKINPAKSPEKSTTVAILHLADNSNLKFVEKIAIRLIARDAKCPDSSDSRVQGLVDFLSDITSRADDKLYVGEYERLLSIIDEGSPAACHLTGVLLERAVEQENFNIGWELASTVHSVNEHTIEEVVTLCSKSFFKFSRTDKVLADQWFERVFWCVERHYKLLGKYPSGLALHVAAHRGDFDLCWNWFQAKREEKSFRFTAHHTSSVLKAATYSATPCAHMPEVLQAYKMTPQKEKSPFVFEPLFHLWQATESIRTENASFWETVEKDLSSYLDSHKSCDENSRKMKKLLSWQIELREWKANNKSNSRALRRSKTTIETLSEKVLLDEGSEEEEDDDDSSSVASRETVVRMEDSSMSSGTPDLKLSMSDSYFSGFSNRRLLKKYDSAPFMARSFFAPMTAGSDYVGFGEEKLQDPVYEPPSRRFSSTFDQGIIGSGPRLSRTPSPEYSGTSSTPLSVHLGSSAGFDLRKEIWSSLQRF